MFAIHVQSKLVLLLHWRFWWG